MMNRSLAIAGAVLGVSLIGSVWASRTGFGVPQPEKQPVSIREESARGATGTGHHRTRYFIGGGFRSGK